MIDPATDWIEIFTVPSARADPVAELSWLTRYPLPSKVVVDRGNELLAEFSKMIKNDYSIKVIPITSSNPQANAILERVHQTIGNLLCTFKVKNMVLDEESPRDSILTSAMFVLRATVQTTMQHVPVQLVCDCNSILNQRHDIDWEIIRKQKQNLINKGNKCENCN